MALAEQETIININGAETTANVYSTQPGMIAKIKKLPGARPYGAGWEADVPKSWIQIRPPKKVVLTPEQKAKRAEILKKVNAARKK